MSYWGWMKYADCYRLRNQYIDNDIKRIIHNVCAANKLHNPLGQTND